MNTQSTTLKESTLSTTLSNLNLKTCAHCGAVKPVSEFYVDSNGKPRSYCKECFKENVRLNKIRRAKNSHEYAATTAGKQPAISEPENISASSPKEPVRSISGFSTSELAQELKSRGRVVLIDPEPRDLLSLLNEKGYKGKLSYTVVHEIDLSSFNSK